MSNYSGQMKNRVPCHYEVLRSNLNSDSFVARVLTPRNDKYKKLAKPAEILITKFFRVKKNRMRCGEQHIRFGFWARVPEARIGEGKISGECREKCSR
jgi:hypothetical protein